MRFVHPLAAGSAIGLALALVGCSRHATPAECEQILDRYVDMTIDGDESLKKIPEETRNAARESRKADKRTTPEYLRARTQCENEVRASQVKCALAAGNANQWEACID